VTASSVCDPIGTGGALYWTVDPAGTTARCDVEFTNDGVFPVSINEVRVDGAAFALVSTTPAMPTTLDPGRKLTVRMNGTAPAAGTLAQGVASIVGARTLRLSLLYDAVANSPRVVLRSDGCRDLGDADRAFFQDCDFFLVNTGSVNVTITGRSIDDTRVFGFRAPVRLPPVLPPKTALFFGVRAGADAVGQFATTMRWATDIGVVSENLVGSFSDPAVSVVGVPHLDGSDFHITLHNEGAPTFIDRIGVVSGPNPGLSFQVDSPFLLGRGETRVLTLRPSLSSFTTTLAAGNAGRNLVQFTLVR
jgi:hypothetical protein